MLPTSIVPMSAAVTGFEPGPAALVHFASSVTGFETEAPLKIGKVWAGAGASGSAQAFEPGWKAFPASAGNQPVPGNLQSAAHSVGEIVEADTPAKLIGNQLAHHGVAAARMDWWHDSWTTILLPLNAKPALGLPFSPEAPVH